MRTSFFTTTLCLGALVSMSAGAGELASAPLSGLGGNDCRCTIVSLSNKTHEVIIEVLNGFGGVLNDERVTIEPGATRNLSGVCGDNNPNYCRVSGKFPRKKFRGVYCVTASTTEGICVPLE